LKTETEQILETMSPRELSDARRHGIALTPQQAYRADQHERIQRGVEIINGIPMLGAHRVDRRRNT